MNEVRFSLKDSVEIYIYGAGSLGREQAAGLVRMGYPFKGFIDQNAHAIRGGRKSPVLTMDEFFSSRGIHGKTTVIICLHNALWHQEVAAKLAASGCDRILFLPVGEQYRRPLRSRMERLYGRMIDGEYDGCRDIPTFSALTERTWSIDDGLIYSEDNYVTVWMEISAIFTNEKLKQRGTSLTNSYGGISVCALQPYIELFQYCKTGEGDIGPYCEAFKKVQNTKDIYSQWEFIQDRVELYAMLRMELNRGMSYFINAAPILHYVPENRHFNVVEGHHRIVFLMQEGMRRIPVKISKADYALWKNEAVFAQCADYIRQNGIYTLRAPVNHPGFYNCGCRGENIGPTALMCVQNLLGTRDFSGLSFADGSGTDGYFARAFRSMGCRAVQCLAEKEDDIPFIRLLDSLAYMEDIEVRALRPGETAPADLGIVSLLRCPQWGGPRAWEAFCRGISGCLLVEARADTDVDALAQIGGFAPPVRVRKSVQAEGEICLWSLERKPLEEK